MVDVESDSLSQARLCWKQRSKLLATVVFKLSTYDTDTRA